MARSLLPSKNREAARKGRARIHRAARRQSRVELGQLTRDPEDFEDLAGLDAEPVAEIRQLMMHRRWGDKVAPFVRWASAIARQQPRENRLSHIRALVPRGVIGEHALQHLTHRAEFEHPSEAMLREDRERAWRNKRPYLMDRGEQTLWLRTLLQAPDGHRAFNRWLQLNHAVHYRQEQRRRPCTCSPGCSILEAVNVPVGPIRARLLLGAHDVPPFLAAMWGSASEARRSGNAHGPHAQQLGSVHTFLRAFKRCRGDVVATARALRLESKAYWKAIAPTLLVSSQE
ncbi:hypothetical protein JRI60_49510 [Archangium violaceum]|uniref:hypothetical protein n=1 Tax=Archangium violaceum TaxID=83451 RepID=UPI00194E8D4F|nr:hypothetical protein [Archangium violaceum]QRN96924.1 hypothetical protein JRI60_49510 [Archangium violaceum]